jgi:hypothetical protein
LTFFEALRSEVRHLILVGSVNYSAC